MIKLSLALILFSSLSYAQTVVLKPVNAKAKNAKSTVAKKVSPAKATAKSVAKKSAKAAVAAKPKVKSEASAFDALERPKTLPTKKSRNNEFLESSGSAKNRVNEALSLIRSEEYEKAILLLYNLSKSNQYAKDRVQIKYILGTALMELKMYQVAAFQFVEVIRSGAGKYTKSAIEKLSIAADALGDETLLSYAISKVQIEGFPDQNKDMINYRLGEIKLKRGQYSEAAQLFSKVGIKSRYAAQALYNRGLAYLEMNNTEQAARVFEYLLSTRASASVVDTNKVAAQIALARTYYQAKNWEASIEAYRAVPRDHEMWHEALFELSWAQLRAAEFRSALSNFQTLHSAYYEDYYIPESLLLRSIVYLYICKYDEMEKVLTLFEKSYGSVRTQLGKFIIVNDKDPMAFYNEIEKAIQIRKDKKSANTLRIPLSVARHVMDEGDVRRSLNYIRALSTEKSTIESKSSWTRTGFANYALKILNNRIKNTKVTVGEAAKAHILDIRLELKDLYEQIGFIRYEMINGKKEQLKKRIAGKSIESEQIDEGTARDFYIQNGYEYWPFDGEYWLDELGNYQYLGRQSCE